VSASKLAGVSNGERVAMQEREGREIGHNTDNELSAEPLRAGAISLMQVTAMGAKDWTWALHVQPACCQLQTKRNAVNNPRDEHS
jgi:hypothetical protein